MLLPWIRQLAMQPPETHAVDSASTGGSSLQKVLTSLLSLSRLAAQGSPSGKLISAETTHLAFLYQVLRFGADATRAWWAHSLACMHAGLMGGSRHTKYHRSDSARSGVDAAQVPQKSIGAGETVATDDPCCVAHERLDGQLGASPGASLLRQIPPDAAETSLCSRVALILFRTSCRHQLLSSLLSRLRLYEGHCPPASQARASLCTHASYASQAALCFVRLRPLM